jgi:hypothetical protein
VNCLPKTAPSQVPQTKKPLRGSGCREKGKRGERQWRDELRANGYPARRGQQFSGSPDSPDVVCDDLAWLHFEVKAVERLNVEDAMEQARRDARKAESGKLKAEIERVPIVAHRRSFRPWLVTMEAETFFRLLRGDHLEWGVKDAECRTGGSGFTGGSGGSGGEQRTSNVQLGEGTTEAQSHKENFEGHLRPTNSNT